MALAKELKEILACPQCKGELVHREAQSELVCEACRLRFAIEDDIPVMLLSEAKPLDER